MRASEPSWSPRPQSSLQWLAGEGISFCPELALAAVWCMMSGPFSVLLLTLLWFSNVYDC